MGVNTQRVMEGFKGKSLIEIAEMDMVKGTKNETVKAFFSDGVDTIRGAFAREVEDHPRTAALYGTANKAGMGILPPDPNGDRRYVIAYIPDTCGIGYEHYQEMEIWFKENGEKLIGQAVQEYLESDDPSELLQLKREFKDQQDLETDAQTPQPPFESGMAQWAVERHQQNGWLAYPGKQLHDIWIEYHTADSIPMVASASHRDIKMTDDEGKRLAEQLFRLGAKKRITQIRVAGKKPRVHLFYIPEENDGITS